MAQKLTPAKEDELKRLGISLCGAVVYALGVNLFVVPAQLYSGGVMGISQIFRTLLSQKLGISFGSTDIAGILYYLFNIPIFWLSLKKLDKKFVFRTVLDVSVMTLMMTLVPVVPILSSDTITSCLVGGVITGLGIGLVLVGGGTLGGFDLVSLMLIEKHHDFSVGRIGLSVNLLVYALCMLVFSVPTAIYSLVYSFINTTTMDRVHAQNNDVEVTVITKETAIEQMVFHQLHRGATRLQATGAYTGEELHLYYIVLNKYELPSLRKLVAQLDPHAFVVVKDRVKVFGHYIKRL